MKTALITGGSRGIGRGIATLLAKNGYGIVLNYKENDHAANECEKIILSNNVPCLKCRCDIRSLNAVVDMHQRVKSLLGSVDIIINNAGVARGGLLQDTDEDIYDYIMDTNLKGTFNVLKVFLPELISKKWGRIVNISSIWGLVGAANEVVYSASKAGVIGLTKALASELAYSNITVNCIAPGAIMTDMLRQFSAEELDQLRVEIPLGRIGEPIDVAQAVLHLIEDKSSYITGQVINISGGFTII